MARPRARRGSNLGAHLVLGTGAVLVAFPFLWLLVLSLSTDAEVRAATPVLWPEVLQWGNYAEALERIPFLDQLQNSVLITVLRTVSQVVLCSMAGYAFARMRFRGRALLLALVLSILMVPTQAYLLPQYQIIQDLGLLNTVGGLVLPGLFSAFGTFLMYTAFLAMPHELEEAARIDGASTWTIFWRVMFPLVRPTVGVLTITAALWSWNELLWPLVVSPESSAMPLSAGLATLAGKRPVDYPVVMAASVMASAPMIILFVLLQRRVVDGLASSGLR
ncbi:carbohydrate ABC transporter permease [Pseudonocardia sp. HH130630-07]|uniref:carbohydrate ABC transporter permease n=1 Tax=Pseudonocardia sp. HH130630-07 TaxID=1690815 RepID=UPI0008152359|nr:carbohydrate ABC transporter permease [Pseudonocardia sp. HH130630-07]ANY07880.1 sugar ABC transporter permease [Pseudonocardia sp. HH130630-07]